MSNFKALITSEADGKYITEVKTKSVSDLPAGDVLINVKYSSLNYKDALSSSGNKGVTRRYPHTPGIDAAGIVAESENDKFKEGDEVIVTGYDLGMNTSGGYGQFIRVPAGWIVRKPENLSLREAMIYGTAGFTAAQSVLKLRENGVTPGRGSILVTGSTGGVGSVAVAMLSKLGYSVTAVTGKADKVDFLKNLGAAEVVGREAVDDESGKPLLRETYAGAVDTVGGNILATALKSVSYGGLVTTCGLTKSMELNTTVFPFILRGVSLLGIDSVEPPLIEKQKVWDAVSGELNLSNIEELAVDVELDKLPDYLPGILKGEVAGRLVVKV